jgi:hypothetical protein
MQPETSELKLFFYYRLIYARVGSLASGRCCKISQRFVSVQVITLLANRRSVRRTQRRAIDPQQLQLGPALRHQ